MKTIDSGALFKEPFVFSFVNTVVNKINNVEHII